MLLIFQDEEAAKMAALKKKIKDISIGRCTNEKFLLLIGTKRVQKIGKFKIQLCGAGRAEIAPIKLNFKYICT